MAVDATLPEDARCLGCGYSLRALPESRCPECGRVFDAGMPETYRSPSSPIPSSRLLASRAIPLAAFGVLIYFAMFLIEVRYPYYVERSQRFFWVAVTLPAAWGVACRVRLLQRDDDRPSIFTDRIARWLIALTALAIFVIGGVSFRRCSHGSFLRVGAIGIAHSPTGGPCHNFEVWHHLQQMGGDWFIVY